jgi:hypothetical protein
MPNTKKPKDSIAQLIKSNLFLYQYCKSLENEITEINLNLNTLFNQFLFIKEENKQLESLLESLTIKLGGELPQKIEKEKKQKPMPIHDDLLIKCPSCGHLYHKNLNTCSKCGLNFKGK